MNWTDEDLQVAALRLMLRRWLKRTKASTHFLEQLEQIGIAAPTRRRDEFELVNGRENDLKTYLFSRWPDYAIAAAAFMNQPDSIDVAQLRALRRVHLQSPSGFRQLNRKTWSAWAGAHSKSGEGSTPSDVELTVDDVLRVRVNLGLRIRGDDGSELDLDAWQRLLKETVIPERAFSGEWAFSGTMPTVILTVENLGAFEDIQKPTGCLLIHTPGWNTTLGMRFMAKMPADIPWWHFGDLDPNGLKIGMSLGITGMEARKPRIWIPPSAEQLLETHSLKQEAPWPVGEIPDHILANESIAWLVHKGRWMEHEAMVLLSEFTDDLASL